MSRPAAEPRGWDRSDAISTSSHREPPPHITGSMDDDVWIDAGWGRVIFGQTFRHPAELRKLLGEEAEGRRDICLYLRDPHVFVSRAPDEFFVDPSYTFRIWMHRYQPQRDSARGVTVRQMSTPSDAHAINRIYKAAHMVPAPVDILWENQQRTRHVSYLVAEDDDTGEVIGTVTGIDHERAFGDPENGCSLWCLAVDPQSRRPGVGETLVRRLIEKFQTRGRAYLDLSVMHDNVGAIALYSKLGFERVPVFCVKRKNPINERLFSTPEDAGDAGLNPYARIIADEARRRGIRVDVIDAPGGYLRLSHGGRSIVTRESLSELTTAVAMSRCDDKRVTRRLMIEAGISVPRGVDAVFGVADHETLERWGEVVVKPARGEQGAGVSVGVRDLVSLERAIARARTVCPDVLIEECCAGDDLRVVVIDHHVVAAAVRRPATVTGTGRHTVRELIEAQSRRRGAATGGESSIALDEHTVETVEAAGHRLDETLTEGATLVVRRTANLHTGGTIHDVTAVLHPRLIEAAARASRALDIPVTGIDFLVPDVSGPNYVFIEANERPGLANHQPQPTAERFVDLLFPRTSSLPWGWQPDVPGDGDHAVDPSETVDPSADAPSVEP